MAVNIKDVAREAGVSITTVSHALNGYPEVAAETRKKVKETADRLGYLPNINGRNLARKGGYRIALVISGILEKNVRDTTTFRRMQGVYAYCGEHDLEVAVYARNPEKITYSQFCRCYAVEGTILSGRHTDSPELEDLMKISIPFVAMDMECLTDQAKCITIDNTAAAAAITRYLQQNGHSDILLVTGSQNCVEQTERMIGVMAAMDQAETPLQQEDILPCGNAVDEIRMEQSAYHSMKKYLAQNGADRHTAILCLDDFLALGIRRAILETGYRIPEDFSLTGFGGSILGEYIEPALTTVEWDPFDCGYAAAELLYARMCNRTVKNNNIPYRIAVRDSVRKL